jgi:hypothetical protein
MHSEMVAASNGSRPVTISKRITPNEYGSERWSAVAAAARLME